MDNAAERHKGGRPRKAVKRTQATGVRFTEIEYNIIKKKALDAGQRLTVYVRNMALNGHVIASLSSEEKQQLRMLSGIANNVNQMAKKAHEEGLLKAAISFSQIMQELEQILGRVKA